MVGFVPLRVAVRRVTCAEGRADGVDAEALCAAADGGVQEAEAGGAALRVLGVQVEEVRFTPDGHKLVKHGFLLSSLQSGYVSPRFRGFQGGLGLVQGGSDPDQDFLLGRGLRCLIFILNNNFEV